MFDFVILTLFFLLGVFLGAAIQARKYNTQIFDLSIQPCLEQNYTEEYCVEQAIEDLSKESEE